MTVAVVPLLQFYSLYDYSWITLFLFYSVLSQCYFILVWLRPYFHSITTFLLYDCDSVHVLVRLYSGKIATFFVYFHNIAILLHDYNFYYDLFAYDFILVILKK